MKSTASMSTMNLTDPERRVVDSLEQALTETGFVMVQGHGIPPELVQDVRRVVQDYFSRPAEKNAGLHYARLLQGLHSFGVFLPQYRWQHTRSIRGV